MSMRTVITHDLASLRDDWQRLWARAPHPHLSHEWHTAWHAHLRLGAQAYFVLAMDGDKVAGIAPLVIKKEGAGPKGFIKLKQLTFHGVHFVDAMDFLTDGGPETDRALSLGILEMGGWDVCELRRFQRESTGSTTLCATSTAKHLGCQMSSVGVSPYLPITGDFETYYAGLGKEWRTHAERKRRKMEREAGGCRLEIVRQPNIELFHAMRKLAQDRLDAGDTRRCPLLEPARFAFLEALLPVFNERGWWRIALLYAGDAITAYQICFELNQTAYLWSLAYHPSFEIYSPGKVLLRLHLEECFKEGMKEFDFMAGDESYKGHWTSAEREQVAVRVTRPVWRNRLASLWKKPA